MEDKHPEIHRQTFTEVYEGFIDWKFNSMKGKGLSVYAQRSYRTAYRNCEPLYNRVFTDLKAPELQAHLDSVQLKHSSLELILTLFKQMYKYAIVSEICTEDKSKFVSISVPEDDEHGVPFSDTELQTLWEHSDDETIQMVLIMCYSGFRITEYQKMAVNLDEMYFQGGIKTAASKNRIVPIHSAIQSFVSNRLRKYDCMIPTAVETFRQKKFTPALNAIGISRHTPHDTRHTFSMLCERYGVRENDRKRMLGHAFKDDITNAVYGHRTVSDLREEIEKIKVLPFVTIKPQKKSLKNRKT